MSIGWLKTKERNIARRAFIGGAGTIVALPLLDSLIPRRARAQAPVGSPKRIIYYYVPNGFHMQAFTPAMPGPGYALTPILEPLATLKADFMVVTGMNNAPARPMGAGDHASGTSAFITCAQALKTGLKLGISADQVAANQIGKNTRVASVQLGIDGGALAGSCDSGYGCHYVRSISWSGEATPMSKTINPKVAFDLLFTGGDPGATAADTAKRTFYRKSVLDVVAGRAQTLNGRLGVSDKLKLDEYLTGVRETERVVTTAVPTPGGLTGATCAGGTAPAAMPMDRETHVKVMSDIMVLAMQCDVSRIFTFMLGNAGGQNVYTNLAINRGHHDISHHGNSEANYAMLQKIGIYEVQLLFYLLDKMKKTPDGTSNLLFNTALYYSSEISDGNRHNHDNMPVIIAGHGGGMLNTGQHYILPTTTKVSNMLLSTLRTVGVTGVVGDSTGPVMEVLKA